MLTKEDEKRIENLYKIYAEEIKPLTFYVERAYFKFPKGLLKEYRDVYDHIARCYLNTATNEDIQENLKKAENHFDRIRLDIYKYVCDFKKREFVKIKKKYDKYDMLRIDNGMFWTQVLKLEERGESEFFQGRELESKNINNACKYLQTSFETYGEILDLIKDKQELIAQTKAIYTRTSIKNHAVGFIIGIITGILASATWEILNDLIISRPV